MPRYILYIAAGIVVILVISAYITGCNRGKNTCLGASDLNNPAVDSLMARANYLRGQANVHSAAAADYRRIRLAYEKTRKSKKALRKNLQDAIHSGGPAAMLDTLFAEPRD